MKDRWWQSTPRRPGLVLAVAMLAALAGSAGITAILTAGGGTHRPLAAGAGLGAGIPAPSSSIAPGGASPPSTDPPGRLAGAPDAARPAADGTWVAVTDADAVRVAGPGVPAAGP